MSSLIRSSGAFAHRNPRLFVLFRVLYNARACYPILAIFFTDLGLTLPTEDAKRPRRALKHPEASG